MRIEVDELLELVKKSPRLTRRPDRIDVDREISNLRSRLRKTIEKELQPWFVLLDEAIQFFFLLERHIFREQLHNNEVPFAIQTSKIKRDLISIRELIAIGQDTSAMVVLRTFVEDLEISMVVALDAELCECYKTSNSQVEFWNKYIGYGRVYGRMGEFLQACGATNDHTNEAIERHKQTKKFCSDSTHGGMTSSLRSAFTPSLSSTDTFHHQSLGAISPASMQICLFVAEECQMFAGSLVKNVTSKSPLHAFNRFSPCDRLFDVFSSAYVLQELILRHSRTLHEIQEIRA